MQSFNLTPPEKPFTQVKHYLIAKSWVIDSRQTKKHFIFESN